MPLAAQVLMRGLPICAAIFYACIPAVAQAGAWMRSEGELQLGMNLSLSTANDSWDKERRLVDTGCTTHRQYADVHGEYGYSYYHTIFADAGISNKECSGQTRVSGLSDISMGLRGRLDVFRNGRTWEVSLRLPVSGNTADPARPGNGEFGLNAGVHFRLAPDPYENPALMLQNGIWSWGTGMRLWTGGLAHNWWGYLDWRRDIGDGLWSISPRLDGVLSFGEGGAPAAQNFRSNDYDKLAATIDLKREINRDYSISIAFVRNLWGKNTDRESMLRLGMSRQWR